MSNKRIESSPASGNEHKVTYRDAIKRIARCSQDYLCHPQFYNDATVITNGMFSYLDGPSYSSHYSYSSYYSYYDFAPSRTW
ncbi:MAG: hypothetical protein HQL06_16700 [Nitrospirae bacterium]|nr:hypothetical protein [Nitrospirota bacterium]